MLNFNPNATFTNQLYELVPTDEALPAKFNPQFQAVLNNTGLLNGRLKVLEDANLSNRVTQAESNLASLSARYAAIENNIAGLDSRLDTFDGLDINPRLAALEGSSQFYLPNQTPPMSAGPGVLWLKDNPGPVSTHGQALLIKIRNLSSTTALWRTVTPYLISVSRKDYLVGVQNTKSTVSLPTSVFGLTVLRATPTGVFIEPMVRMTADGVIEVFWNIPNGTAANGYEQPIGGYTPIFSADPPDDFFVGQVYHNVPALLPNHLIWVKTGLKGGNGVVACSVKANLALDLRQG